MNKKLTFTYKGKEYTLEYTRKSIQTMERQGFVVSDMDTKPLSTLPQLFAGAFLANHRFTQKDTIDEIYEHLTDKKELVGKLAEMYAEPINAMLDDPEDPEGNVTWTASF